MGMQEPKYAQAISCCNCDSDNITRPLTHRFLVLTPRRSVPCGIHLSKWPLWWRADSFFSMLATCARDSRPSGYARDGPACLGGTLHSSRYGPACILESVELVRGRNFEHLTVPGSTWGASACSASASRPPSSVDACSFAGRLSSASTRTNHASLTAGNSLMRMVEVQQCSTRRCAAVLHTPGGGGAGSPLECTLVWTPPCSSTSSRDACASMSCTPPPDRCWGCSCC